MTAPPRQSLIAWQVFWSTHPKLARAKSFVLRIIWDFVSAIGRSWWRVGIASGAGILLVLNKETFATPTLRSLSEHVGIGLIVAGIAVFGYEFRSAARDLLERIDRLQGMIDARAQEGLQACLIELLPDDHHVDNSAIRATVYTVVQKLHETQKANPWNVDLYVRLIGGLLNTAASNVEILDGQSNNTYWCTLHLPSAAQIADEMLSAQMNAMRPGDKYDVLSDFTSWSATRLKLLFEANGDRSMKGIMIRRIFCIFDHDYRLAADIVLQVVTDHWQQARRPGSNYQVGFITARGNWKHQGNFMHGDKCIRFEPDDKLEVFEFFRLTTRESDDSLPAKAWRKVELDSERHTEDDLKNFCARVGALWASPPDIS